jgi:hypothetical protein
MPKTSLVTMKVLQDTRQTLKILAAKADLPIYEYLDLVIRGLEDRKVRKK